MVTDTHLLDLILLVRETLGPADEGRRGKRLSLTSPRLNSKSGCGSEGISSLHPQSDWSSDYYVRWRQLKVTKLGFRSRCVLRVSEPDRLHLLNLCYFRSRLVAPGR